METDYKTSGLVYQEDINNLVDISGSVKGDRVMKFIQHHYSFQRPRLQMLDAYYRGFNKHILDPDSRRVEKGKADYRATHSFAKYIADFQTSYSAGNPISIRLGDNDKDRQPLDDINKANDVDNENYELFLDISRFGRAYELTYRDQQDVDRFIYLDPEETFIIYDQTVDPKPVMAVRYHQIEVVDDNNNTSLKFVPETWTNAAHTVFNPVEIGGVMVPTSEDELVVMPVVEYQNNRFRQSDFENVIPLIDLYDAAQSDTANYMTDLNDAMLVLQGDINALFQGADLLQDVNEDQDDSAASEMEKLAKAKAKILQEMKDANLLLLQSGVNSLGQQTSVSAGYIHKEYDVEGTEAYKKRLEADIHKFSHTPNLTDENFAGNVSGVAMKYKLLGTVEMAATKRRFFEKGLYQRYAIIDKIERTASNPDWKINPDDIVFTFQDNLPADDISMIQQLAQTGANIPQAYLYQYLPNVDNPDQITKMLDEQQKAAGEYQFGNSSNKSGEGGVDNGEGEQQ